MTVCALCRHSVNFPARRTRCARQVKVLPEATRVRSCRRMYFVRRLWTAPHFPRHLDDALEFAALHILRDRIAAKSAGEPALRGKAQIFQRNVLRCRVDAPL